MTLMQKYANDDDAIGIENLNRWPASSKPVKFLATTTSASSVAELEQVRTSPMKTIQKLNLCSIRFSEFHGEKTI